MRACLRETLWQDVLSQAVRTWEFSNGAVKNCLSATPPSITGLRLHPSPGGAITTESQRGIDASCFENMCLGFDSTFIFYKCFPSHCLAVYTAVGGCSPSQTPYYSNAGQNPAASDILLASVRWGSWSYFLHFGASPKPGWPCAGCSAR